MAFSTQNFESDDFIFPQYWGSHSGERFEARSQGDSTGSSTLGGQSSPFTVTVCILLIDGNLIDRNQIACF